MRKRTSTDLNFEFLERERAAIRRRNMSGKELYMKNNAYQPERVGVEIAEIKEEVSS